MDLVRDAVLLAFAKHCAKRRRVGFEIGRHHDDVLGAEARIVFERAAHQVVKHLRLPHGARACMDRNRRIRRLDDRALGPGGWRFEPENVGLQLLEKRRARWLDECAHLLVHSTFDRVQQLLEVAREPADIHQERMTVERLKLDRSTLGLRRDVAEIFAGRLERIESRRHDFAERGQKMKEQRRQRLG